MSAHESHSRTIEIAGDTLIPDADFCATILAGADRRTARRYDAKGLPFIFIRGEKWRPLNAGKQWLAARIVEQGKPPKRRRTR